MVWKLLSLPARVSQGMGFWGPPCWELCSVLIIIIVIISCSIVIIIIVGILISIIAVIVWNVTPQGTKVLTGDIINMCCLLRAQTNDPHESRPHQSEAALGILKSKALSASEISTSRKATLSWPGGSLSLTNLESTLAQGPKTCSQGLANSWHLRLLVVGFIDLL